MSELKLRALYTRMFYRKIVVFDFKYYLLLKLIGSNTTRKKNSYKT